MNKINNPNEKIIIALDGMDRKNVLNLLEKIPEVIWVKVGLELFVSEGPDILSILKEKGKKIFLQQSLEHVSKHLKPALNSSLCILAQGKRL